MTGAVRRSPAALRRAQERRRRCPVERGTRGAFMALGGILWLLAVGLVCLLLLAQPGH